MNRILIICFCYIFSLTAVWAHPGIGIVMDSKGNVFYTDLTHVWKIQPNGDRSIAVKNVHTHELYLDEQDNLYGEHEWYKGEATDKWGNYVWCLSNDGVLKRTIPEVEGFLDNLTLVRDIEGNSYWAKKSGEHQMLNRQTPDGKNTLFTKHKFRDIRWMYFSKTDKNLYLVDQLKIKQVSPDGNVSVIADNLKESKPPFENITDRHYLSGIWTDKNENLYVAIYGASKVKRIGANGEFTTVFESEEGWSPCGGMIDKDGAKWIMEFSKRNKTRITKITKGGKKTIFGG